MEEQLSKIKNLILKSLDDDLSYEESAELDAWLADSPENQELYNYFSNTSQAKADLTELNDHSKARKATLQFVLQSKAELPKSKIVRLYTRKRLIAVAIIFAIIAIGVLVYQPQNIHPSGDLAKTDSSNHKIAPGKKGAKLTLDDGTEIVLNEKSNGLITKDENTEVNKLSDGKIAYSPYDGKPAAIGRHILKTGTGEQYEITLPDGSSVQLNSKTQLIYPPVFAGETREVILTSGEAYFKIAKDATRPFHLNLKGLEIVVKGTEFNVRSYNDEAYIESTLFEGRIKGRHDTLEIELKPGQQLKYDSTTKVWKLVNNVNLEATASWIHGLFSLNNTDVPTLFREISRWYDIDVVYANGIPKGKFEGQIPMSLDFMELLEVLDEGGIKTKVEGRKLIVL